MSETKELTYEDVQSHNGKKVCVSPFSSQESGARMYLMGAQDLYVVVHGKVYDATKFVDEHPYVLLALSSSRVAAFPFAVCVDGDSS